MVYSYGWPKEKGGNAISKDLERYVEAYDTDLWDQMLSVRPINLSLAAVAVHVSLQIAGRSLTALSCASLPLCF